MNILNNILSIKIKNRIKLIQKVIDNPYHFQKKILLNNISVAKKTVFGQQHNFRKIQSYEDFKEQIPIREYHDLKHYIDLSRNQEKNILWPGKTKWFAKSSGTTQNKSKFIPVTKESLYDGHFQAGKDMLSIYLNNYPHSNILNGKSLMIGGSTGIRKFNSYQAGDVSGIIIKNLPIWVQLKRAPSIKTALLENWEEKIKCIIQETTKQNITSISGVPSWTILLINRLMQKMNIDCLTEVWPNLELYMHGGISFDNYKCTFNNAINSKKINYLEIYNASEGFFGIQENANDLGLLLLINHGVFYEFIPIKNGEEVVEEIVSIKDVQIEQTYVMIITTNGGLWRYKIGDTIIFTSLSPYKIKIKGRVKSFINAFGEELDVDNANNAVNYAAKKTNSIVHEYIAAPFFYKNKTGCHEWIIEFQKCPHDINDFNMHLDSKLKEINSDYEAKRFKNILLKKPLIRVVKNNFFYNLLKKKNKIGGQNKIKRLYNNRKFIEDLIKNI